MRITNNLEKKTSSDNHWRVQLVCKKIQPHRYLELEFYHWNESSFITTFLTILAVTEILCSFSLILEEKTDKLIRKSSRLEFLKNF